MTQPAATGAPAPSTGTPPPSTGTPPPSGGAPAAPADWTAGLNEATRGFVENRGFKDPQTLADSYVNLEKLMGVPKDRLLQVPEKDDDAEGWGKVYNRLGRPEKE